MSINLGWSEIRFIICRPELNKLRIKKLKEYIITGIEPFPNKNSKIPQI